MSAAEAVDETLASQVASEEGSVNLTAAEVEAAENAAEPVSRDEFDKLKAERDGLLDRLARLQAEFENARKRGERERVEFREYATGNVVEQFLPVLDNFELALKHDSTAEQLSKGVELIVKQMHEILRQLQVNKVATVGEEFDPRVHEAIEMVDTTEVPDHHVLQELQRGYKYKERMLRPAMVRVARNARG